MHIKQIQLKNIRTFENTSMDFSKGIHLITGSNASGKTNLLESILYLATTKSIGPSGKEGGDLGFFTKGAMVPEFSEKAFSLEKGAYTKEPVQTQFGWHVILVEDKRKVKAPEFEEVLPRLKAEQSRAVLQSVFDDLRSKATITRKAAPVKESE